jgi:hypothetical protein
MDDARRYHYLKLAIVGGMLGGLALSPHLWLSTRLYPLTPVAAIFRPLPAPFDRIFYGIWMVALVAIGFAARPARPIAIFLGMALWLALGDQSRWQPWFYQYLIMLLALAVCSRTEFFATCRVLIASIYFWSGMQKLNPGFLNDVYPWLIAPFVERLPALAHLAAAVPFLELAIGPALFFRRTRAAAVIFALGMHGFILIAIGPMGHDRNSVVWIWNLAMAAFLLLLFGRPEEFMWKPTVFQYAVFGLVTVAPALSFAGMWDNYLSWALYSGNKTDASVTLPAPIPGLQAYVTESEDGDGYELSLYDWSFGELNVPPYPEARIYRNVAGRLCEYGKVTLEIEPKYRWFGEGQASTEDCTTMLSHR